MGIEDRVHARLEEVDVIRVRAGQPGERFPQRRVHLRACERDGVRAAPVIARAVATAVDTRNLSLTSLANQSAVVVRGLVYARGIGALVERCHRRVARAGRDHLACVLPILFEQAFVLKRDGHSGELEEAFRRGLIEDGDEAGVSRRVDAWLVGPDVGDRALDERLAPEGRGGGREDHHRLVARALCVLQVVEELLGGRVVDKSRVAERELLVDVGVAFLVADDVRPERHGCGDGVFVRRWQRQPERHRGQRARRGFAARGAARRRGRCGERPPLLLMLAGLGLSSEAAGAGEQPAHREDVAAAGEASKTVAEAQSSHGRRRFWNDRCRTGGGGSSPARRVQWSRAAWVDRAWCVRLPPRRAPLVNSAPDGIGKDHWRFGPRAGRRPVLIYKLRLHYIMYSQSQDDNITSDAPSRCQENQGCVLGLYILY